MDLDDLVLARLEADLRPAALDDAATGLPVLAGLTRAIGALARFALEVVRDDDGRDPIDLVPRILRTA